MRSRSPPSHSQSFNPRSPRGERLGWPRGQFCGFEFQSTLPAWGATQEAHGEPRAFGVSIHAPRVGSDHLQSPSLRQSNQFQSTLPAWGATFALSGDSLPDKRFNPRSPRGERQHSPSLSSGSFSFNPRSPRGERPGTRCTARRSNLFQSTLPAWGATAGHLSDCPLVP